jgi:hypothetical protein
MKKVLLLITAILTISSAALADVRIKSKQTMGGQVTENTVYIKGKRQRTELMGGMMISLMQCDLGRDLQINPATKTYMVTLYNDGSVASVQPTGTQRTAPVTKGGTMYVTTTIRDTGERKQMFGYTARHIIQTLETDSSPDACSQSKTKMEMDMWVIDAEFGLMCQRDRQYVPYSPKNGGGCTDKIVQKTLGTGKTGYPVWQRMTSFDAAGKESYSMTQEVTELSKATLDQALFDAPADYREVSDASQMYASAGSSNYGNTGGTSTSSSSSAFGSNLKTTASSSTITSTEVGAKKPGTIRIGLANVKTGAVGEGISASDLSAAVANSLGEYLKGTNVEVVTLEAKLASAQAEEARQKECDYIINAAVSHKKGGGGFGFGKFVSSVASHTGVPYTGSNVGNAAVRAAVTTASLTPNVKSKDEVTLEIKLNATSDNTAKLAKQFKAKAKSDGDDIISTVIEQAAQAIIDAVGK